MDLYCNELSLAMLASTNEARRRMEQFATAVARGESLGMPTLMVMRDFCNFELAPSYNIYNWCQDKEVRDDLRVLLMQKAYKEPFLEDVLENYLLSEVECHGEKAIGLLATHLFQGISISLDTDPRWEVLQLGIVVNEVGEDGNIASSVESVRNAATEGDIEHHDAAARNHMRARITTGQELWDSRQGLFPNLDFCSTVDKELVASKNPREIQAAKRMLGALDEYAEGRFGQAFAPNLIRCKVSPESESTLIKFGKERTFVCPDGITRLFSWHCKDNFTAWRAHFFWDSGRDRSMIVGYVGPHLPTVRDPT
jgi:hypothetical protein